MIYDPFLLICCSVSKSCPTLCNRMNCSTPGFPVLHYLPELTQIHVHWVSDASNHLILCLLSSCPQSFPASGSFPMSRIFTSGGQSIGASASASFFRWIFMIHSTTKHLPSFCHVSMLCSLLNMEALFSSSQQSCETGTLNISTSQMRKQRFTQVRWLDKDSKQQSQDWSSSHLSSLLFSFLRVLEPPRPTWSWDTLKAGDKSETRGVLGSLLTLSTSPHSVFPSLHSPLPTASSSPPIFITLPYKTAYNFLVE